MEVQVPVLLQALFPLDIYPAADLQDHVVDLFLIILGTSLVLSLRL